LLVVGDKEVEAESLAVRDRTGKDLGVMTIEEFSVLLQQDVDQLGRVSESAE
jgi:threonyl-tRNA synthetase